MLLEKVPEEQHLSVMVIQSFYTSKQWVILLTIYTNVMEQLFEEQLKRLNLTTLQRSWFRGDPIEVFKTINGFNDLPLDGMVRVCNEEQNRLRGHLHVLENAAARLESRCYSFHTG